MEWVEVCVSLPEAMVKELEVIARRHGLPSVNEAVKLAVKMGIDVLRRAWTPGEFVDLTRRAMLLSTALGLVKGLAMVKGCADRDTVIAMLMSLGYTRKEAREAVDTLESSILIYKPSKERDCYKPTLM